jgi:hypothetical protein
VAKPDVAEVHFTHHYWRGKKNIYHFPAFKILQVYIINSTWKLAADSEKMQSSSFLPLKYQRMHKRG